MSNNICEIVSSDSAIKLIKELNDNEVICLEMNLNIGKLDGLKENNRNELNKYNEILKYDFKNQLNEISKYDNIRIWSSIYDADDYCLLLFLCSKFKDKNISVIYSNEFNNYATTLTNLSVDDIKDYLNKEHILKDYEKEDFFNEWIEILEKNSELRYMLNGKVNSINIDYFNNEILNRLKELGEVSIYKLIGDLIVNPIIPKIYYSEWIYTYLIDNMIENKMIIVKTIDNKERICINEI